MSADHGSMASELWGQLRREMYDVWWELRDERPRLDIVGPLGGPRAGIATAWQTGSPSFDAFLAESRTDDEVQYLGIRDTGLEALCDLLREQAGEGVRWILSGWDACVDHLLPECPAVRRRRGSRYGRGLVDPTDPSDLCGWCFRVWNARHRQEVAA